MVSLGVSLKPSVGRVFVISAALISSAIVLGVGAGYRVNVTPSLPLGLYHLAPLHHPLRHGDLVTFTLPASRRLHRVLANFTKPVAGLPGDHVCVQEGRLLIHGTDYGPVLPDAPAHALQEGACVTVGEGHIFTASVYPRSYDGRYYGMIPIAEVQRATPVFTWKEMP
jgi:signal peptidase I